jgi:cytochrome c oxidase cbb3-type subunit 1
MNKKKLQYPSMPCNYQVARQFAIMTAFWGIVGMLIGFTIASQWAWPKLNLGLPWTHFGRLRPLHTNSVIFAFGSCALFTSSYYAVQPTCQNSIFGIWTVTKSPLLYLVWRPISH